MIEAEILKDKFRSLSQSVIKVRITRSGILVFSLLSAGFYGLSLHPTWIPESKQHWMFPAFFSLLMLLAGWGAFCRLKMRESRSGLARRLEKSDPTLNGLAITAAELLDKPEPNFLDRRALSEFTDRAATQEWDTLLLGWQKKVWTTPLFIFVVLLCANLAVLWMNRVEQHYAKTAMPPLAQPSAETSAQYAVTVSPGDVEIEKGSRLVVEATFAKEVPAEATLIVLELDGKQRERIPMRLTVDDQVFGAWIAKVDKDARYLVEFGEGRSKQHSITTFVYPKLEQVDVKITPPAYTKLPTKQIKNTMKITAMEGSRIDFSLKINKPVKEAELFGEDKTVLPLKPSAEDPTRLVAVMKAEKTQKWRVHLVDAQERANQNPPWVQVNVATNQLAKIEVVFPKRDVQVSPIQELPVEAKVWDDLSVSQSGVSFSIAGKSKEVVFRHLPTEPAKKQVVQELLMLEGEKTQPRQLVSYHFWAEDRGPQGEVRRAMSDLFFAEVRHFEDIFREGEAPPGEAGKEPKGQTDELVELQKQIVNATWRIVRDTNAGKSMESAAPDVKVVQTSQSVALGQTKEAMEKTEDAEIKMALTEAWKSMKDALDPLEQAVEAQKRAALNQALTFEQSALEWLHQAQSREHRIMRSKSSKMASGKQKQMQNQLMNLELKQEEQRYEEAKQASEEQTAEQQENLQVLSRLKELARRQEALAEKMKELQNQMAKAPTEETKQELENQLKRLEDEQKQMLSDIDDLQQRMEQPDQVANLAEAKQQLEQTRERVSEAAEKLRQQKLADATNAATRAQRDLEKLQEDFKAKTAKRFSEEMKQMRQQAREVADQQKQIAETLERQKTAPASEDTSRELDQMLQGSEVARQIQQQQDKVTQLLDSMQRVSEQAEGNHPLLHRRLYEAVREARTGGLEEHLDAARLQSRYGQRAEAQDAERKANALVDKLQEGVEKAAESVLGSEAEALRMARAELDTLIDEAAKEEAAARNPSDSSKAESKQSTVQAATDGKTKEAEPEAQAAAQTQPSGKATQPGESQAEAKDASPGQNSPDATGRAMPAEVRADMAGMPGEAPSKGQAGSSAPSDSDSAKAQGSGLSLAQASSGPQVQGPGKPSSGQSGTAGSEGAGAFFFEQGSEVAQPGPLTGEGYQRWTDRLRKVEELLNRPELRNEAAKVLDQAREMRIDHERNDVAPQAEHLQMRILNPLVELRDRVAEELAKRDAKNPTVPVDRDPLPPAFRELVKRYYQELGQGD